MTKQSVYLIVQYLWIVCCVGECVSTDAWDNNDDDVDVDDDGGGGGGRLE